MLHGTNDTDGSQSSNAAEGADSVESTSYDFGHCDFMSFESAQTEGICRNPGAEQSLACDILGDVFKDDLRTLSPSIETLPPLTTLGRPSGSLLPEPARPTPVGVTCTTLGLTLDFPTFGVFGVTVGTDPISYCTDLATGRHEFRFCPVGVGAAIGIGARVFEVSFLPGASLSPEALSFSFEGGITGWGAFGLGSKAAFSGGSTLSLGAEPALTGPSRQAEIGFVGGVGSAVEYSSTACVNINLSRLLDNMKAPF